MADQIRRDPAFQETCWTRVRQAIDPDEQTMAMRALGAICADYWYPIYAFVRRKGHPKDEAEDITQTFFAQLSAEGMLAKADAERGRLRNFLLWQLKSLLSSLREKKEAKKRGGDLQKLSLDMQDAEGRYLLEPVDSSMSPDSLFARAWALKTLERCIEHLGLQWSSDGKAEDFAALRPFLSLKQTGSSSAADVAQKLEITEENARQKIKRIRMSFAKELRKQVAESLADPSDANINAELESLRLAVSGGEADPA